MHISLIDTMLNRGLICQATADDLNLKYAPSTYTFNEVSLVEGVPIRKHEGKIKTFDFALPYLFGDGVTPLPDVERCLATTKEQGLFLDWSLGASPSFAASSLHDYIARGFAVRASPAIYTGEDTKTHWLRSPKKKKYTQRVLEANTVQARPIENIPNWLQLVTVSCEDYGTSDVATCMYLSYLEYINGNPSYLILELVEDGKIAAIVSLYKAKTPNVVGNVWQYQFILKLRKEPIAKLGALLCAEYLHKEYGDTLLDLTSDISMYYPMYQTYKFNVSNCWLPLAVMDSFVSSDLPKFEIKEPYLLDNEVVGKSRVLSVKDTPTHVDGSFGIDYPQQQFFNTGWTL